MNNEKQIEGRLKFVKGALTVDAAGYWFTSGGEKGSFGYYPHLKKQVNGCFYPVYPDTQIHGDLKMAALWLCSLEASTYSEEFVYKIFGYDSKEGKRKDNPSQSLIYVTDLSLAGPGRWRDEYFQVKPRIGIEDDIRTTKEHMLVSLEMAFMEDQRLTADIYIYGLLKSDEFEKAKNLLKDAAALLSGFGAFRSRGYGRGKVEVGWQDKTQEMLPGEPDAAAQDGYSKENKAFVYMLKALVNFRSKQIDPGATQLLTSRPAITSEQLRGWFIKMYEHTYNKWPEFEELAGISFPTLYPSRMEHNGVACGYPPAMSTIKNENGDIRDMAGKNIAREEKYGEAGRDDRDNFFSTKTKPLPAGWLVTDTEEPETIKTATEKRIRNSTRPNFATLKDGGLFVQEYIGLGTSFAGIIKFLNPETEFYRRACAILEKVKPVINGCIFEPSLLYAEYAGAEGGDYLLVTEPITFCPGENLLNFRGCIYVHDPGTDRTSLMDANQITLASMRAYNTMLYRPGRQRIVVAPGSVIRRQSPDQGEDPHSEAMLCWKGFGKDFKKEDRSPDTSRSPKEPIFNRAELNDFDALINNLLKENFTRAQAGIFREFLNEKRSREEIRRAVEHRINKYREKQRPAHEKLYSAINGFRSDREKLRAFINYVLDGLRAVWWNKDNP